MAQVPMTPAVAGQPAIAADNNAIIDNVDDLASIAYSPTQGNAKLRQDIDLVTSTADSRLDALEALVPATARFAKIVHTGTTTTPPANYEQLCDPENDYNAQQIPSGGPAGDTSRRILWMQAPSQSGGALTKLANDYEFRFNYTGYWDITATLGLVVPQPNSTSAVGQVQAALINGTTGSVELLNNDVIPVTGLEPQTAFFLPLSGIIEVDSTSNVYYLRAFHVTGVTLVADSAGGATYLKAMFERPL